MFDDWKRGVVTVEPAGDRGKVRWFGEGRGLSFDLCQGMKRALAGADFNKVSLSERATERLEQLRDRFSWVRQERELTLVSSPDHDLTLWTFAGAQVNSWLALALAGLTDQERPGDLGIRIMAGVDPDELRDRLAGMDPTALQLADRIEKGAIERLKFAEALFGELAGMVVEARMRVDDRVREVVGWGYRPAR